MGLLDKVLAQVRACGERITMQRRLVIEALCSSADHMTIGDIRQYLRARGADHTLQDPTIYRILQWLKSLQLVSQTDMGAVGIVYALISDPCHHHLICLACGGTTTLDDRYFADLRQRLHDERGFEARIEHMAIYGLCRVCASVHTTPESSNR